ncbi:MAG: hypothetical protein AAF997_20950 [Myxococcota bacterium]
MRRWVWALIVLHGLGCTGRKQVPFGLEQSEGAGGSAGTPAEMETETAPELATGEAFEADTVEVPVGDNTLVLENGYALASLRVDLDGDGEKDALVVAAAPDEVLLLAAYPRGITVTSRVVDSFRVPTDCVDPSAELSQLSESLFSVTVTHACPDGLRQNWWIGSAEAQPRVRERITLLPLGSEPNESIVLTLRADDVDGDGYEDIVAETRIGGLTVPLTWLNRPGGFARDVSQPEAALAQLANDAFTRLGTNPAEAGQLAGDVVSAFTVLCRESGDAKLGLSGTQGLICGRSPATGRALTVAAEAAIRRGDFVGALAIQRKWDDPALQPSPEDRARVEAALQKARNKSAARWERIDTESITTPIYFTDADTLVIGGARPRKVTLSSGTRTSVAPSEVRPTVISPDGRFRATGVRVTCAGFEAVIAPTGGKRTHRVTIERVAPNTPCRTPIDRPASIGEWTILGWAPQGLIVARGDRLRIVPLSADAKAAGKPSEVRPGSPLPAPVRGPGITSTGTRYVIAHPEGLVVRDWKKGGTGLWLRPPDWDSVPGEVRSVALSPDGQRAALQKGSEIRLVSW